MKATEEKRNKHTRFQLHLWPLDTFDVETVSNVLKTIPD